MKIPQFIAFIAIVVVCAFSLTGGLSLRRILVAAGISCSAYLVLRLLSRESILRFMLSDRFPGSIKNDL